MIQILHNTPAYIPQCWVFPTIAFDKKSGSWFAILFIVGHKNFGIRLYKRSLENE